MSTTLSSFDATATDTYLTPKNIDAITPTTLISWSQEQTITSIGSLTSNIPDSKSTSTFTSYARPSLPSSGIVASSDGLTHGHLSLQGVSSETNASLIPGTTAASPPVTTTWSSSYVIFKTSLSFANGTYYNQSTPVATLYSPGADSLAVGNYALQSEQSLVPPKQAAVSSTDSAQPSQLGQSLALGPSPAQSGPVDSDPHPATGQQRIYPSNQAASLPVSDTRGSASSAYILLGSSTYFLPQITTQPAPVVAGKPVVDAGGGNFQVNGQTLSRGGATANVEGISVHVNPQGAPVVGTQTYPPLPTAATSTIGTHTVVVNTAGVIFDGQQIVTNAAPLNTDETQMPFQTSSVTPGSVENGPMANEPAGADIPASDSILKLPSEPAVSSVLIGEVPVVFDQDGLKVQGTPLAAGANTAPPGTTWALSPSSAGDSINLDVGTQTYHLPQMTPPPLAKIAGHEIQALGPSIIAIDGQTLTQGAPSLTISSSVPVIFGSSNLVIGTSTIPIRLQDEVPTPSILTLAGGQRLTQVLNNPNAYLISGTTLLHGSPAAIIGGTTYSLAPSGALILGTSTIPLATAGSNAATGILTAGSEVFTPLGSTAIAVNGVTLSLSGPGTTDHGTVLSLGPGGLAVGSSTYAYATPTAAATVPPPPSATATAQKFPITTVLSAAGQTVTANPLGFSIGGTSLSPGSPGITISGTSISLGTSGILNIGSSTINLLPTALNIASQTFTPNPTAFSIAGTTLTAGGPGITISGTPISLGTSGVLDIAGSTIELSSSPTTTAYTIAGQIFTPNPTAFPINGTTITAGGPGVTISGTPVLLQQGGELVIGNTTIPLPVSNIASATSSTFNLTTNASVIPSIPSGGGAATSTNGILVDVGSPAATAPAPIRTDSRPAGGGAVGMRTGRKRFWWEGVGLMGLWIMMMVMGV